MTHHHTMGALVTAFVVALVLPAFRTQEPEQASPPSVADAARAARERRNSAALAKNILTNDDVGSMGGSTDDAAVAALEPGIRAQIERSYPANPTSTDLEHQMTQLMIYSKSEPPERMFAKLEDSAIHNLGQLDFPGKRDWEAQLNHAVQRWMQESGQASKRIEEILNENREVLASRDPVGIRKVRAQWLDAVVPSAAWQSRVQQLIDDGKARAAAYLKDSSGALEAYRHSHAASTESIAVLALQALQKEESGFKSTHDRYTCDVAEFAHARDNAPRKPDANWSSGLDMLNYWGYRVEINGCNTEHFVALAVPPVASGNDRRAFCTSELGTIHVAQDGSPEKCLAQGIVWSGK